MTRPVATDTMTILTPIPYQQGRVCTRCGLSPAQLMRLSASNWIVSVPAGALLCQRCFSLCTKMNLRMMAAGR